ncbi:TolC family protein [Thiomonas delicata]|uniref:Putative Integral outer membrane protein TolC,efflux pump component n=1 Tax=Thiomonas delicata TaxID=364030 RepID=A0A238D2D2_THIDL|nr:TolC family protein [Thiomonas delicata]SBP87426.1 putative Integral outer membrane protein TolC,efflux pump component [Thiomonas delicata]
MDFTSRPFALRALVAALALLFTTSLPALAGGAPQPGSAPAKPSAQAPESTIAQDMLPQLSALPRPTLPSFAQLDRLLADTPLLHEAQAMRQAALQNGQALRSGTQEFTGQAQVQQRRIDAPPDNGNYAEWQVLINRQIRLPSQAQADNRMADALTTSANAGLIGARQQLLTDVLAAWFAAQRAQAEAALAQQNLGLMQGQVHALQRRKALGDASVLELEQMQAEEARAQSALLLAQGLASSSRAALEARYPALAGDTTLSGQAGSTAQLVLPDQPADALRALVEQNSATLARDRAALQQAQAKAGQATAARTPQPTVGAYVGADRGGRERIIGLQFAMPFGGPARVSTERAALAEVDAAQWRLRDAQALTLAEFQRLWATAQSQAAGAKAMDQAAQVQIQASVRMLRAYQLGEAGISDWLLARRSALDAVRQALQSRFDAAESAALLKLQAGLLFDASSSAAVMPAANPVQPQ